MVSSGAPEATEIQTVRQCAMKGQLGPEFTPPPPLQAKSIVGAGSFVLPYAFLQMGIAGGVGTIIVAGMLSYYTIMLIVTVRQTIQLKTSRTNLTYADLALYTGGRFGFAVVYLFTLLTSLGACGGYLVFMGKTLHSLDTSVSDLAFAGLVSLALLPLAWINNMKHLSFSSVLGDVALLLGLIATMWRGAKTTHIQPLHTYKTFDIETFGFSFGMCIQFLFLPIYAGQKRPENFGKVLAGTLVFVIASNSLFGVFGYLFYGDNVCPIVVLNLGASAFLDVVKIALCLDLYFTFPIVLAPSREILERSFNISARISSMLFRVLLVGVAFGISRYSKFGNLTDIIGGICMCSLGFVIPPFMMLRLAQPGATYHPLPELRGEKLEKIGDESMTSRLLSGGSVNVDAGTGDAKAPLTLNPSQRASLIAVLVFGVFAVIMTGYFSIKAVVENRSSPNPECN